MSLLSASGTKRWAEVGEKRVTHGVFRWYSVSWIKNQEFLRQKDRATLVELKNNSNTLRASYLLMTKSTSVNIAKITWKHILKISDAQDAITDVGILNVEDRKKLQTREIYLSS